MRRVAAGVEPSGALLWHERVGVPSALSTLWRRRELVWAVAERDIRARYTQSLLGLAWAVISPLVAVGVFTVLVQRIGRVDSGGVPYPLFAFLGLLPWQFLASALVGGSGSLLQNLAIISKASCPREVFPIAAIAVAAVDSVLSLAVLGGLFVFYAVTPAPTTVWVLTLLPIQLAFTMGLALAASVAVVYMRDLRQALGGLLQLGLFLSPVLYPMDRVPGPARIPIAVLNPYAAVIDGYRRAVLEGLPPNWSLVVPAAVSAALVLVLGYVVFLRLEGGVVDVS